MALWIIENEDEAGEGMFVVDAPTKEKAIEEHNKKNPGLKITSVEKSKWVDLALVTGERGESMYFERQRASSVMGTGTSRSFEEQKRILREKGFLK